MTQEYDCDVLIVGSGVIGSNAATELAKNGKSIIILEAGVHIPRWKIVENFRNSSRKSNFVDPYPNSPVAPTSYDREYLTNSGDLLFRPGALRLVGGTTWHWGAACWRYTDNDLKLHSTYGVGRDWPITYNELEPYYVRAEYALGVCGNNEQDQTGQNRGPFPKRSSPYPMEPEGDTYLFQRLRDRISPSGYNFVHEPNARATRPYDGRPQCQGNNNCMPVCPIGSMYSGNTHATHAQKAGANLITDAIVYKIEKDSKDKIVAVHYMNSHQQSFRLTAKYFILAAHGFETPKLLILSDIANSSGQVGRNLMGHASLGVHIIADEPLWSGRGAVQQGGILNGRDGDFRKEHSANMHSIMNQSPNEIVTNQLIDQGYFGKELDIRIKDISSRYLYIESHLETLPQPTNTVFPNFEKKDALGIPMLKVHYQTDNYLHKARPKVVSDFEQFIQLLGGTPFQSYKENSWGMEDHIMGTVIMGDNPQNSVVNHECRSWDHPNLFLATTGVFPASGVVNPTLTGIALSLRVADIIDKEI